MSAAYLESLFGLSGKTAVVIGGNGVLGGALGEGIARAGAFVVLAGRDAARGEERAAAIRQTGEQAVFRPVDVAERASQEALLERVVAERGGVELLVNCAGVNSASSYFEATDEAWERVLKINLLGTHLGCQLYGRHMADSGRGGAILNIGSVTADVPLSRVFAYSASKAAVVNLTKNVAREFAPFGVRVNVLCPGFFPAEQNRKILDEKRVAGIMAGTPLGRFGQPEELVGAALLLLSPAAGSFITGAEVYVDGGFTANRF